MHGKGWRRKVGVEGQAGALQLAIVVRFAQAFMTQGKY